MYLANCLFQENLLPWTNLHLSLDKMVLEKKDYYGENLAEKYLKLACGKQCYQVKINRIQKHDLKFCF